MKKSKKKVLFISFKPFAPPTGGSSVRINTLVTLIRDMGHEVFFIYAPTSEPAPRALDSMKAVLKDNFYALPSAHAKEAPPIFLQFLKKLIRKFIKTYGINVKVDSWYKESLYSDIKKIGSIIAPDVVIAEYIVLSKAFQYFDPHVIKAIDTHDVNTDHYKVYSDLNMDPTGFSVTQKEETKALNRADVIIGIQPRDTEYFAKIAPKKESITIGHTTPLNRITTPGTPFTLLFIGSAFDLNFWSIKWFIDETLPLIRLKEKRARLVLAGNISHSFEKSDGIEKLGFIESVEDAYRACSIVINPTRAGTGLKIKNIEALGYGKPLVTTTKGALGLEDGIGESFLVGDSPEEFCDKVISLFEDKKLCELLSKKAFEYANTWNTKQVNNLANLINSTPKAV